MDWTRLDWTGTPRIDTLGSLYGSDNNTASGVLGAGDLRNDAVIYSASKSSCTLRDSKGVNVESDLQLL